MRSPLPRERDVTPARELRCDAMDDDEGTIHQRIAQLEDRANTIRGLLTKARLSVLAKPNVESAMKITTLQDLLKSTLARAEWLRRKGLDADR